MIGPQNTVHLEHYWNPIKIRSFSKLMKKVKAATRSSYTTTIKKELCLPTPMIANPPTVTISVDV